MENYNVLVLNHKCIKPKIFTMEYNVSLV